MAILFTGGAGRMGSAIRANIQGKYPDVRIMAREPGTPLYPGETEYVSDLSDIDRLVELCDGVDTVLHFGGIADERAFPEILENNIVGTYNMFEAARRAGVRRIVFASSNHAIGFYPITQTIDATVLPRPDSYYGLSKVFGESLGRLYHDKWGLEVINLRIGSCRQEPEDARQLSTWLSWPDAASLIERCIDAPGIGYLIVYGASANDRTYWDNSGAAQLGWEPKDNAEAWADVFDGQELPSRQGGNYVDPEYVGGLW